jgi:hypothetical protein
VFSTEEEPPPQARLGTHTPVIEQQPGQRGVREGLVLLVFAIVTLGVSAYVLAKAEHKAVHDPAKQAERGDINGLDKASLLREVNLRRALVKVASGKYPLVSTVSVRPARVNATARNTDGIQKVLTIDPAFKLSDTDFGTSTSEAVPATKIDASGPERMARTVAERTGLGVDAVDYVTMNVSAGLEPTWYMSLKEGPATARQWVAAPDGTDVRKPGEPSRAMKRADARRRRALARDTNRQQRLILAQTKCLQKATTADAAARCISRYAP